MAIVWRDEMSIDGGIIDADHKCLIALVNDVESIQPGRRMPGELAMIVAKLDAYARLHFEREERLQVATAFTYGQAHHRRHEALMRELAGMHAECGKVRDLSEMGAFHAHLCDFLYYWLMDHILKVDRLMKPFVGAMRLHSEGTVPLAKAVELSQDRAVRPPLPHRQLPI